MKTEARAKTTDSLFVNSKEFLITEHENCFRINKSHFNPFVGSFRGFKNQHNYVNIKPLISDIDNKKDVDKITSLPKENEQTISLLKNNHSAETIARTDPYNGFTQSSEDSKSLMYVQTKSKPSRIKPCSKGSKEDPNRLHLQIKYEVNNKQNIGKRLEDSFDGTNDRIVSSSNQPEIAYAEFIKEVKTKIIQRTTEFLKENNIKEISGTMKNCPNGNTKIPEKNCELKTKYYQWQKPSKTYDSITIAEDRKDKYVHSPHSSGPLYIEKENLLTKYMRPSNYKNNNNGKTTRIRTEKLSSGHSEAGANVYVTSQASSGVSVSMPPLGCTPFHPEPYHSLTFQHWPMNYTSGAYQYQFSAQDWIHFMGQANRNVDAMVANGAYNDKFLLPYTGVAGYNWPTIRKQLQTSDLEEKNNYPVYVKPPVLGNDKTEQIRNAYVKYVKWIKFKLHRKSVRKQKQSLRRERNKRLRSVSNVAKPRDPTLSAATKT